MGTAALLAVSLTIPQGAGATSNGAQTDSTRASSTSWGVVVTPTTVTSAPSCPASPYCANYVFTLPAGTVGSYLDAWNTGSVTISGLSFLATWSGGGRIKMDACSVAWNTATGTCSGTQTTVFNHTYSGTYDVTTAAAAVPAVGGTRVFLHVIAGNPKPQANVPVTLSTSVCSGGATCTDGTATRQIRPAVNVNA